MSPSAQQRPSHLPFAPLLYLAPPQSQHLAPPQSQHLPARAPSYSTGKRKSASPSIPISPHSSLILSLHSIGWNISNIAHVLINLSKASNTPISFPKAHHIVKQITQHLQPLTLQQILPITPFSRLIPSELASEFEEDQLRRMDLDYPKERLSSFDIHMIKILAMMGWKKKDIARDYRVSNVLISVYTQDLEPYSVEELQDLFPSLFNNDNA